jgi:thiamine biosynthesis lipoprotein
VTTAVRAPRTVHVEHCMGTVFTIDIRDDGRWDDAIRAVVDWLHEVDAVFSTYRETSELSRLRSGELDIADAHPEFLPVLELCAQVQLESGGAFSALRDGQLDPTGLVKGWAVERASRLLREHGSANHAVNGGVDMQLAGEAALGRPWGVGVVDPRDRMRVLTVVTGRDLAVATSGTAERGAHILDPRTGRPARTDIASATVVGPALTFADAYATAAVVLGREAVRWIDARAGYAALLVTAEGERLSSARWHQHVQPR